MGYDKEKIFQLILSEIEEGASLRSICRREDMPSRTVFFEWLNNDESMADQYARACELRAESIFEEILDIADDTSNDTIITERGESPNNEWIARSRLRVDARKWALSKMQPKKYGDKLDVTTDGKAIQSNISILNIDPLNATDDSAEEDI